MSSETHVPTVVISGYYGFDNTGDEAVLAGFLEALRGLDNNIRCIVLSANPDRTRSEHAVEAVPRMSLPAVWAAVKAADVVVSGGGSLFQDVTSLRSVLYYAGVVHLASLADKPAVMFAQGVGPLRTRLGKQLTAGLTKRVIRVSVRDSDSAKLLTSIGFDGESIIVSSDPVFALSPSPSDETKTLMAREGILGDRRAIGISVRWTATAESCLRAVGDLVRRLTSDGHRVLLIPFHYPDDLRVCDVVAEMAGLDGVTVLRQAHTPRQLLGIIGSLDLVVGMRLHSLIFAARMAVPFVGMSYDPKVSSFCGALDMDWIDIASIDSGRLTDAAFSTLARGQALKEELASRCLGFWQAVYDDVRAVIELAKKERKAVRG